MQKITFYTNSIFPELTRIWYHFIRRISNDTDSDVVIYDCGSRLKPAHFENATIIKHPNHDHGRKIDHFIRKNLRTKYFFLMDDDVFLLSDEPVRYGLKFLEEDTRNAICTFLPRHHWKLEVKGVQYQPMGSYALMVNHDIILKERLSFRARKTNDPAIRSGSGYYDTADYINEQLLVRDYKIKYVPQDIRNKILTFWGTSSGYVSLFKRDIFGRLKLKSPRKRLIQFVREDPYNYQRAYMVASIIGIYEKAFNERSSLSGLGLEGLLEESLSKTGDESKMNRQMEIKAGIDKTSTTLLEHF